MTIALFAGLTLGELVRRRLAVAVLILTLAIIAFTAWGLAHLVTATTREGAPLSVPQVRAATAGIVMLLAFAWAFVIALGAALIGAPALADGIANGEILALLARPIRRADIVLGRWLGTLLALAAYVLVAGGGEFLVVRLVTGYVPPHPLTALAFLIGIGAIVTTAAVALATRLSALTAGAIAALAYGAAWIGGIVESIGLQLGNAHLADAGTIVTLLFPADAFWRSALFALQPAVFAAAAATQPAGTGNPFSVPAAQPAALLWWSLAWVIAVLAVAVQSFRTRDL